MWSGNEHLRPSIWVLVDSVQIWWENLDRTPSTARRGLRSIIILVCWEVWTKRNARIFERKESAPMHLLQKIKEEAGLWGNGGSKAYLQFIIACVI